eukprot:s1534_g3.t1
MARVGEAMNPGPVVGTYNARSLLGKAALTKELPEGLWGVTESHLTAQGSSKFRQELRFRGSHARWIPGAPAPKRSSAAGSIGGTTTGVGLLSHYPARALTSDWEKELWETSRIQAGAACLQGRWIKMGVAYCYAQAPKNEVTRENSDRLLAALTERIVNQSKGYRVICGDFNQDRDTLRQTALWRAAGFVEAQQLAKEKWGQDVLPTCNSKTVTDYLWLSPELVPLVQAVKVDSTIFPDHAALWVELSDLPSHKPVPVWRKPLPLPWEDVPPLTAEVPPTLPEDPNLAVQTIFHQTECDVHDALKSCQVSGLLPLHRGRCVTVSPVLKRHPVTPVKRSRPCDVAVTFLGEHFQHTAWVRQLRRLQSLMNVLRSNKTGYAITKQRTDLWKAIRGAPGFPGGFPHAWCHRPHVLIGTPICLPKGVPTSEEATAIFRNFEVMFQQLEQALNKARSHQAKARRVQDPHLIYRDLAKEKALPVQTLVTQKRATVVEVSSDRKTLTFEPAGAFVPTEPVTMVTGMIDTEAIHDDRIVCQQEQLVVPGEVLMQQQLTGDFNAIFESFRSLWNPMWNRHEGEPVTRWDSVIEQLCEVVPPSADDMPFERLTTERWLQAAKKKKARTATGPDGVSKLDLTRMSPGCCSALVMLLNRIEDGQSDWPDVLLCGHISAIEKSSAAETPSHYRPITVLSLVYRTWASLRAREMMQWIHHQCPDFLIGNRPGCSTFDLWYRMSQSIEGALFGDEEFGGLITDVCKAFNTLPRPVVYALGRRMGLPLKLLDTWHRAIHALQRRFLVAGACSPPCNGVTGYPEGDALSVLAMMLINVAMHLTVQPQVSPSLVHSYVDNWEITSCDVSVLPEANRVIHAFAASLDITLDTPKTFYWATTGESRKYLRDQNCVVKLDAKDLGGHMNFSKRATMYTIRNRIQSCVFLWDWIARSPATIKQKLVALVVVAWPRCLHGISSHVISSEHFTRMRSAAMSALRWAKHGASSLVQFGLSMNPIQDPEFYAIWHTVMSFRRYACPAQACTVLSAMLAQPWVKPRPGPCCALLTRIHQLGWQWACHGFVRDHEGFEWSLFHTPIQWLRSRLKHAWYWSVGSFMHHRDGFSGLGRVDPTLTFARSSQWTSEHAGLMRAALNGTFFTRDKQKHGPRGGDDACPWCQSCDSIYHRHWECGGFEDLRAVFTSAELSEVLQMPQCFLERGWVPEPPQVAAFRASLGEIPDQTWDFVDFTACDDDEAPLNIFTDGSCKDPTQPSTRLATWAVCVGDLTSFDFPTVASGGLTGHFQTIQRAELTAAIVAIRFALHKQHAVILWTDNQHVYDIVHACLVGSSVSSNSMAKDHDLVSQLVSLCNQALASHLLANVVKVCSHQNTADFPLVDRWACLGNEAADSAAERAYFCLPARVQNSWRVASSVLRRVSYLRDKVHAFMIQVGRRSVQFKHDRLTEDVSMHDTAPVAEVSLPTVFAFDPLPDLCHIESRPDVACFRVIRDWLEGLCDDNGSPTWWSSYQLLAHFQHTTAHHGFTYRRKDRTWSPLEDDLPALDAGFLRHAQWFTGILQSLARWTGCPCTLEKRIPTGHIIRCWTRCMGLRVNYDEITKVDNLFALSGANSVKAVRSDFAGMTAFARPCALRLYFARLQHQLLMAARDDDAPAIMIPLNGPPYHEPRRPSLVDAMRITVDISVADMKHQLFHVRGITLSVNGPWVDCCGLYAPPQGIDTFAPSDPAAGRAALSIICVRDDGVERPNVVAPRAQSETFGTAKLPDALHLDCLRGRPFPR